MDYNSHIGPWPKVSMDIANLKSDFILRSNEIALPWFLGPSSSRTSSIRTSSICRFLTAMRQCLYNCCLFKLIYSKLDWTEDNGNKLRTVTDNRRKYRKVNSHNSWVYGPIVISYNGLNRCKCRIERIINDYDWLNQAEQWYLKFICTRSVLILYVHSNYQTICHVGSIFSHWMSKSSCFRANIW